MKCRRAMPRKQEKYIKQVHNDRALPRELASMIQNLKRMDDKDDTQLRQSLFATGPIYVHFMTGTFLKNPESERMINWNAPALCLT